jgi:ketosteroid isomerase-like protein
MVIREGRMTSSYESQDPGTTHSTRKSVEIVEQIYDAFRRRDLSEVFSLFAPAVEIYQSNEIPWGGNYKGQEEAKAFFSKLTQSINSTLVLQTFIDAGDHVVAIGRTQGTVNATGSRYDIPIAHVWTITAGRVSRIGFYIDNPTMQTALTSQEKV